MLRDTRTCLDGVTAIFGGGLCSVASDCERRADGSLKTGAATEISAIERSVREWSQLMA